nr:PREDICTED: PWWP domain-containing protein 2A [Opisthocomus hoazin]
MQGPERSSSSCARRERVLRLQDSRYRQSMERTEGKRCTAFVHQQGFRPPSKLSRGQQHPARFCAAAATTSAGAPSLQRSAALLQGGLSLAFTGLACCILLLGRRRNSSRRISHDNDSCAQRQDEGKVRLHHKKPSRLVVQGEAWGVNGESAGSGFTLRWEAAMGRTNRGRSGLVSFKRWLHNVDRFSNAAKDRSKPLIFFFFFFSSRFGPHGIPVTIFPKREYKDKPEAMQLQSKPFQDEAQVKCESNAAVPDDSSLAQPSEPSIAKSLWTSKPPPLFHEGAPYPPPLFIRDTYNQSIPQPPPRKIKRPKRKMYREEPTSIMNAIKLRPRQVLCDKCKNSVVAEKKEIKKGGNASDSSKYEDNKKRRNESVTTVNKKLKTDHKVDGKSQNESQKRKAVVKVSNIAHSRSRVVKVSAQANTSKAQLNTKKVLQSKNMDHAKAREVLKMAKEKAQKKQSATSSSKNAHSKVHFTRRLQNTSSGSLPPRLRLKPQRYRNEENDSSLKTGLEKIRSGKMATKPQSRCSSTRSAGEAPSESQSPSKGSEEASGEVQDTSEVHVTVDQDEHQTLGKRGSKSNITVYMTLNQKKSDSSSASVCSSDSTDDLKSTNSECSSTESFDFPPGSMHAPSSSSSSSKEEKKLSNSLKTEVFSKNVSKCVTPDGRTVCVGDIVWAKIYGFPWWPARVLTITVSRKDNGLLVRQEARISWFGSTTTSFLALAQLSPFLESFQLRFNKKRKGLYRKAVTEAAKAAKQLTPEVRALLTQFET